MGCDIHLHQEVKINGVWHHYGHPDIDRDYPLFSKMAGVRPQPGIDPISPPRGLPDDVTVLTRLDSDDWCGYSHSWLSAEEIATLFAYAANEIWQTAGWFHTQFGELFDCNWGDFWRYQGQDHGELLRAIEDVRFVFWFDN